MQHDDLLTNDKATHVTERQTSIIIMLLSGERSLCIYIYYDFSCSYHMSHGTWAMKHERHLSHGTCEIALNTLFHIY